MKLSKLNLKTIVLVALFVFYLVILLSNLFVREGMETKKPKATPSSSTPSVTPTVTTKPLDESEESTEDVKPTPTHSSTKETTKPKK